MQPYFEMPEMPDLPIKIFNASTLDNQIQVHPHWHKEIEVLYICEGHAKQQIGNHFFDLFRNDIVVIGKNQLHSTYSQCGSNCNILVFMFNIENFLLPDMSSHEKALLHNFSNSYHFFSAETLDNGIINQISLCLYSIWKCYEEHALAYELVMRSQLYQFISLVLQQSSQSGEGQSVSSNKPDQLHILKNTFFYIDEHFSEEIPLAKAASLSNLSVTHFCRLFKKTTGMTFNDYLNFYRVNRAEKLLFSNKLFIQIALDCGFGSVSSFIRNFKKYKNCTPTTYKNFIDN